MAELKKYRHNVLEGFGNGCLLDLRVRIAIGLLEKSPLMGEVVFSGELKSPDEVAGYALDVATELLRQADERGLIEDLPEDEGLNSQVRKQAARTALYGTLQQIEGQKALADEGGRVAAPSMPFAGRRQ